MVLLLTLLYQYSNSYCIAYLHVRLSKLRIGPWKMSWFEAFIVISILYNDREVECVEFKIEEMWVSFHDSHLSI